MTSEKTTSKAVTAVVRGDAQTEAFKLLGKIDSVDVLATEAMYHEPCMQTHYVNVMDASIIKLVAVTLALVQ